MSDGPYTPVVNEAGQYSVWWVDREPPEGWRRAGTAGTREECLARIAEIWPNLGLPA